MFTSVVLGYQIFFALIRDRALILPGEGVEDT